MDIDHDDRDLPRRRAPGDHWQLVGEIEDGKFWNHVRRGSSEISTFYLSGYPDNAWVQTAKEDPRSQEPFWIAINLNGASRVLYADGAIRKYLVSTEQAAIKKSLRRRPPEHHPGKMVRSVMIGIELKRNDEGLS